MLFDRLSTNINCNNKSIQKKKLTLRTMVSEKNIPAERYERVTNERLTSLKIYLTH